MLSRVLDRLPVVGARRRAVRSAWEVRHAVVVFTVSERDIQRLDIARGPCVPARGRSKPLAGPFRQDAGTPDELEALFRILVPDASGPAWLSTLREGDGEWCVFSDEFVEPLAALSRRFQGKESRATDEEFEAEFLALAERWVAARGRPGNGISEQLAIADAAWWARAAQDRSQHLHAWFGPMVSFSSRYRRSLTHGAERR